MEPFKFCTLGLTQDAYKSFTCPPKDCPDGDDRLYEHVEFLRKKTIKTFKWWNSALNCKVAVTASSSLNGKLIVQITDVQNAQASVYLQPNNVGLDSNYHGLVENDKIYKYSAGEN